MSKHTLSEQSVLDEANPSPAVVVLRDQLRDALADNERLKANVGDDEALFEYIRGSIKALPPYERVKPPRPQSSHAESEACAILTDGHSEEVVDPEQVEGLAKYDWETFQSRILTSADKVVELAAIMRQTARCDTLNVWLLGDWFMGEIIPDDLGWGSSMPLPCALPGASRTVADAIMRMAAHFQKVRVVGICGNHGRTTKKPAFKMGADRNWDYALYLIARAFTERATNVEWTIPRSKIHVTPVMGWKVALTHGDVCKRTHTHPYFGISQAVAKERASRRRTDREFDHVYMGHWHHFGVIEDDVMICPSMIGHSEFTQYAMHAHGIPQQMLCFYTEKHGRTCTWPINLA